MDGRTYKQDRNAAHTDGPHKTRVYSQADLHA